MALSNSCCPARRGGPWSGGRHAFKCVLFNHPYLQGKIHINFSLSAATGNYPQLRRGRSLLAREEDVHESGLALFKRGATLRRKRPQSTLTPAPNQPPEIKKNRGCYTGPGPSGPWMMYCWIITAWVPPFLMKTCGMWIGIRQTWSQLNGRE